MATELKGSVRRQIDRLRKDLAVATGQVAALQAEIKRHELVYDMLDGRKTAKRCRQGRSTVGALKRGPRGRLVCRGSGARWRSPARRVLVALEVAFAESRPSTFSVDAVGVRGVDICPPFRLSDPFGYPAGSLERGSFYPQYRPVSAKPHPCSLSGHAVPGAAPFPGMPALVGRCRISAPVSLSA